MFLPFFYPFREKSFGNTRTAALLLISHRTTMHIAITPVRLFYASKRKCCFCKPFLCKHYIFQPKNYFLKLESIEFRDTPHFG